MESSGMLRHVTLVRTEVSEELSASIIRVTRIGELGTTLAEISNRRTLEIQSLVPPKCRYLQEPHGVTSQKTPFYTMMTVFPLTDFMEHSRYEGHEAIHFVPSSQPMI
jgi:hypothetical protein